MWMEGRKEGRRLERERTEGHRRVSVVEGRGAAAGERGR